MTLGLGTLCHTAPVVKTWVQGLYDLGTRQSMSHCPSGQVLTSIALVDITIVKNRKNIDLC